MSTAHPRFLLLCSQNMVSGGMTNNCRIQLAEGIHRMKAVNLCQFSIPNTIYTIKQGVNDCFCLNDSSTDRDAFVEAGVYTAISLASAIETAIADTLPANTYSVTYDSVTMHFRISNAENNGFMVNWFLLRV